MTSAVQHSASLASLAGLMIAALLCTYIDWTDSAGPLLAYVMPVAFCVVVAGLCGTLVEALGRVAQMDAEGH